ncbi:hypothetical protein GTO89_02465 [Heliobacterium gestii]|uniref:Uncharacterized protein n=1 Tax=Heliomicrobium gestii TaxID=2699 RepID=A0A845LGA9_HELGE|nr:hypothetical protein [Heliomicrobium gestii]MBM7865646.1 hypothetical protein [Heliomicrobium gestii]MZP41896.1 hypothetical protein [Heliomicrobium gestii]
MSGPKSGEVSLSEEARRALEEERERRLEAEKEKRRAQEEERRRRKEEEKQRKRALEEERRRAQAEEQRRRADEEARRRALEVERRRREEEKIAQLAQEIQALQSTLRKQKEEIAHFAEAELAEGKGRIEGDAILIERLEEQKGRLLAEIDALPIAPEQKESVAYEALRRRLVESIERNRRFLDNELHRQRQELKLALEKHHRLDAEARFADFAETALAQRGSRPVEGPIVSRELRTAILPEGVAMPSAETPDVELVTAWHVFCADVEARLNSGLLDSEQELRLFYDAACHIYGDSRLSDRDKSVEIDKRHKSLLATVRHYDSEIARNRGEREAIEALYLEYAAHSALLGQTVRDFPADASMAEARRFRSEIETELPRLREALRKNEEMEYVAKTVDTIMNEMGHTVVAAERLVLPNRNLIHSQYRFDDSLVVNVFTSDTGGVMFEVSGVSEEKRPATALEKLKVKEGMERFCGKYRQIREKMMAQGLRLSNEDIKPADVRYARLLPLANKKRAGANLPVAEEKQRQRPSLMKRDDES